MKPYCLIVNPNAGRGKSNAMAGRIEQQLQKREICWKRWDTTQAGDAEEMARALQPEEYSRIVVVGGDGTLNEVVRGLTRPAPPIAVFPAGTGNDVARMLGISSEEHALTTAIHGVARKIDLGLVSGEVFINIFSFGFDAAVATQANEWKNRLPGWLLYPAALVKMVFYFQCPQVTLRITGEEGVKEIGPEKVLLLAVCNGSHYGGGMNINPLANPFDGKMELCIVRAMPWWKILALFPTVYKGTHLQFREVSLEKVTAVSFQSDRVMLMNRDGETWPEKQGAISLIPEGLTVMCPEDITTPA